MRLQCVSHHKRHRRTSYLLHKEGCCIWVNYSRGFKRRRTSKLLPHTRTLHQRRRQAERSEQVIFSMRLVPSHPLRRMQCCSLPLPLGSPTWVCCRWASLCTSVAENPSMDAYLLQREPEDRLTMHCQQSVRSSACSVELHSNVSRRDTA